MRTLFTAPIIAIGAFFLVATSAQAETFPVIKDPPVLKECGDSHMAFPPETLPKATWQKIIGNLSDHFGEDASLDAATAAQLTAFHMKHASDVSNVRAAKKWRTTAPVTRIIDAPRFIRKHKQCPDAVWAHDKIKSKSNCLACHQTMQTNGSTKVKLDFLPPALTKVCGEDD